MGLSIILSLLAARGLLPDPFERARLFVFDTLQRAEPWATPPAAVEVVDIDDESLRRVGQWPWSRSTLAALVRALQDLGARAIAFDALFAEPDRTSPALLAKTWEHDFGWSAPVGVKLPDYDLELATAFERGRVVVGFALLADAGAGAAPAISASFATIGADPTETLRTFRGAISSLPVLEAAAAGDGALSMAAGRDQTIRRLSLLYALDGKLMPSLALEALRVAQDEDTIVVRAERDGGPSGAITGYTVRVGAYEAPLDRDGSLILHHGPRGPQGAIAAWRLLDPDQRSVLASKVDGRVVVVGASAIGLSDLRATPLESARAGGRISHARAIEQIMARHFLIRPAWASGAEFVVAALASAALVTLAAFASLRAALVAAAAGFALLIGATVAAFMAKGLVLDPSFIALTMLCSGIAASFARYFVVERDAAWLRSAFAHYLSPALVQALARDPSRLKLGGEQREMTFLFTDLEGFTSLTETVSPETLVGLLNAYLDGLCRVAMEHGGTVDKIVGDAVHVMFNAPLDQADHAERGVRCALAIDAFARRYAVEQRAGGVDFGATRIGVNTGAAVVGNFGGGRRFDYTAHGDAINTAARLELANKTLGTRICVARATAEKAGGVPFLPIGTLMLKGKAQGVDVFTPYCEPPDEDSWSAVYLDAFARMSEGDDAGAAALIALHERHPDNPILALHARRIRAGERSALMAA